jgi:hypothetical protein
MKYRSINSFRYQLHDGCEEDEMLTKRICVVRCVCVIVKANILRIRVQEVIVKSAVVVREYKWCTQPLSCESTNGVPSTRWLDPAASNNNYRTPPADFKDKPVR